MKEKYSVSESKMKPNKKIVYIDMDDVLCDFTQSYNRGIKRTPEIKFPQSQYGFFANLEPIRHAILAYAELSVKYDVYILTAPSEYNPMSYTEKRVWVEKYLGHGAISKLIISPNKALLKGEMLIDDMQSGKGQENFEGRLIHFGGKDYPNWKSILKELLDGT